MLCYHCLYVLQPVCIGSKLLVSCVATCLYVLQLYMLQTACICVTTCLYVLQTACICYKLLVSCVTACLCYKLPAYVTNCLYHVLQPAYVTNFLYMLQTACIMCYSLPITPSPKQPFSFLGRLAINSYLALCQQESDSVACGSAWLTVHSGGWGYRVICVFPSSLQLKK